jgi:hypothetical protein
MLPQRHYVNFVRYQREWAEQTHAVVGALIP